jgi:hypothetical protein
LAPLLLGCRLRFGKWLRAGLQCSSASSAGSWQASCVLLSTQPSLTSFAFGNCEHMVESLELRAANPTSRLQITTR